MWAIVTSAVYLHICIYMVRTYICTLINTPTPEGVIISQPKNSFMGVIFDVDHDFEGPRSPRAHLGTVLRNLSSHLRRPFRLQLAVMQLVKVCTTLQ